MSYIRQFYDEVMDEEPPIDPPEETTTPSGEPERLAQLMDTDSEHVTRILRLVDGVEAFPAPPTFPETERLLPDVGMEGFQDTLVDLWTRIKRWLAKVRQWIINDGKIVNASLQAIKFNAENLKVEARSRLGQTPKGEFEIHSHITSLSTFYKPPKDIGSIVASLRMLEQVVSVYFEFIDKHLIGGMGRIAARLHRLDPQRMDPSTVTDLADELAQFSPERLTAKLRMGPIPGGSGRLGSVHLLGNQRLAFSGIPGPDLRAINSHQLRLVHSELTPRSMPASIRLPRFGRVGNDQCLDQVLQLCRRLEVHTAASMRRARERALDEVATAVDHFTQKIHQSDDQQLRKKEVIQQVVRVARTTNDWANNPYHGLLANCLKSLRGAQVVCRANFT